MPLRTSLFLACLACASAPLHAQDGKATSPGWIEERPVPQPPAPVSPLPHWYEVRGGAWQVPLPTLRHIASLLTARLAGNDRFDPPRPGMVIQFRGDIADGARIVRLYGNCSLGPGDPHFSEAFMETRDGGHCVFDAEYDPAGRGIRHFSYYPQG